MSTAVNGIAHAYEGDQEIPLRGYGMRAPFTHYEKSAGGGEVDESARGHGMRRAIGELATCPYCTGPWIAASLTALLVARRPLGRTVAGVLAMVTVSDWLHRLYGKLLTEK